MREKKIPRPAGDRANGIRALNPNASTLIPAIGAYFPITTVPLNRWKGEDREGWSSDKQGSLKSVRRKDKDSVDKCCICCLLDCLLNNSPSFLQSPGETFPPWWKFFYSPWSEYFSASATYSRKIRDIGKIYAPQVHIKKCQASEWGEE